MSFLLAILVAACENGVREAPQQVAAVPVQATSTAETDRKRNCRDDAARVVARLQRIEERDQRAPYVMGWRGRINTRDGRCYAEVRLFDPSIACSKFNSLESCNLVCSRLASSASLFSQVMVLNDRTEERLARVERMLAQWRRQNAALKVIDASARVIGVEVAHPVSVTHSSRPAADRRRH